MISRDTIAESSIGFLLQRAHNELRSRLLAELSETALHLGHVAILGMALRNPGVSQSALSAMTGIEKSSMVLFVDLLEREGWIRREPDPADRRRHALTLTPAGVKLLGDIGPKLRDAEHRFLVALTAQEQQTLRRGLAKIVRPPE